MRSRTQQKKTPRWEPEASAEERSNLQKLLLDASETVQQGEQMREAFVSLSGFHKLDNVLQWIRDVDANQTWSSHWILSPIPGHTKMMLLASLFKGVDVHKQFFLDILNLAGTVLALILSATLGLLMAPPDIIFESEEELAAQGLEWVPYVYNYSLALSVGVSIGVILVTFYMNLIIAMIVRDADWIRIMFLYGDSFVFWSLCGFFLSILPILPPIVAIWAPTALSIDSSWGRGMIALILVPTFLLCAGAFAVMDLSGTLHSYWLRTGTKVDDPPDTDMSIQNFARKIELAKEMYALDARLHRANQQAIKPLPDAGTSAPSAQFPSSTSVTLPIIMSPMQPGGVWMRS